MSLPHGLRNRESRATPVDHVGRDARKQRLPSPRMELGFDSRVDLRAATFAHSCLNRLQLRNTLQMVDLANQSASLLYAGELANPPASAPPLALAR